MPNVVVVGAQWGDEGKGKIVDRFTEFADVVARYQGGQQRRAHAGGRAARRRFSTSSPAGVLHKGKTCVIGNGVVVDPTVFMMEIDRLKAKGYLADDSQLVLSLDAHVIMPWHKAVDLARESAMGAGKIGTTGRGIGPTYEDKVARRGIRVRDLLDAAKLARRVKERLPVAQEELRRLGADAKLDADAITAEYAALGKRLAVYAKDASRVLHGLIKQRALGPLRGGAGHHARRRPRHLPVRHQLEHGGRERGHRDRRGAHRPSTRSSASPRPTARAWAEGRTRPSRRGRSARSCAGSARSSARPPAAPGAPAGSTRSPCATRRGSTASTGSPS